MSTLGRGRSGQTDLVLEGWPFSRVTSFTSSLPSLQLRIILQTALTLMLSDIRKLRHTIFELFVKPFPEITFNNCKLFSEAKRDKKDIGMTLLIPSMFNNYFVHLVRFNKRTRNSMWLAITLYCKVPHSKRVRTRVYNHIQLFKSWQFLYNIWTFEVGKDSKF
jgi:hypothetical protein